MMREVVAAAGVMVVAGGALAGGGGCDMAFSYANFNGPQPTLTFVGSAGLNAGGLRVTPGSSGQSGAVWRAAPVSVGQGFRTTFRCRLPDGGASFGPGDGMALVLQREGNTELGGGGSEMGYGSLIGGGLAVELDSFAFGGEFPSDHVSIQVAQFDEDEDWWALRSEDDWSVGHAVLNTDVNDPQLVIRVEVMGLDYGAQMDIVVIVRDDADGRVLGAARAQGVEKEAFLDEGGCTYIGFTAATGGAFNEHRVLSWDYQGFADSCAGQVQFHNFAPQTVTVMEGESVTVSFDWTMSTGPWEYLWEKETGTPGETIVLDDSNEFFGTHSNELTIGPATPGMAGHYNYGIHNACLGAGTGFDLIVITQPPACPADLGVQGGTPGQDTILDNNDFVVFITYFFQEDPLADFGVQGGSPGHDELFDNNDFVVFITEFFAGCG